MIYCLDTNAVSDILRKRYNVSSNMDKFLSNEENHVAICPVVYYEIMRGLKILKSQSKIAEFMKMYNNDNLMIKLPFDYDAAEKAAEIYETLHRGKQIEDNDVYIEAVAIVNGLYTCNSK